MAARGRPFEPGNQFGRGRPRGSRNKTTMMAQELIEKYKEPLIQKCVMMALKEDPTAMRLCMERLLPPRKGQPVTMRPSRTGTPADISQAYDRVWKQVRNGELTPSEAEVLGRFLEARRRALETEDLDWRLRLLEESAQKA